MHGFVLKCLQDGCSEQTQTSRCTNENPVAKIDTIFGY